MVLSPALWVPTQDRAAQQDFQALNSGSPGHPTPSQGSAPACSPTQCSRGPNAAGAVWFPPLCCASVSPPPTALEKLPVCPRSALGLGWKHPVGFLHPQQPDKHTRVALGLLQGSRGSIQGAFPSKPSPALRPCRSHTCAAAALRSMRVGLLAQCAPSSPLHTPLYQRGGWVEIHPRSACKGHSAWQAGTDRATVPPQRHPVLLWHRAGLEGHCAAPFPHSWLCSQQICTALGCGAQAAACGAQQLRALASAQPVRAQPHCEGSLPLLLSCLHRLAAEPDPKPDPNPTPATTGTPGDSRMGGTGAWLRDAGRFKGMSTYNP